MTRYTPLWQQGGSYTAAMDRQLIATLFPSGGALGVVPAPVSNTMNVSIPVGRAVVPLAASAGVAHCYWDAAEVVTSPAAPPAGNTRIDLIVLQVRDPQLDAGVNNDFVFVVLSGANSTGTPVAPTVPANAMAICQYTVPASVANLNGVAVSDLRQPLGTPTGLYFYNELQSNLSVTATSVAAAQDVINSGTITFDGSPCLFEFSAMLAYTPNVAGGQLILNLVDGSTDQGTIGQILGGTATSSPGGPVLGRRRLTPTAGPHNYKVRAWISPSGTGGVNAGPGGAGQNVPATFTIRRA